MKHDLTTGTWQDDTGCPISIVFAATSDVVRSSMPQGLRGSIPGGGEMRAKGDDGGCGRGWRGTISSVLGGALLALVALQERMVGIASSFAAKASDGNALGRTWRRL